MTLRQIQNEKGPIIELESALRLAAIRLTAEGRLGQGVQQLDLIAFRLGFLLLPLSCCRAFLAVPASWLQHSESGAVLGATERGGPSHRPPPPRQER